MAIPTLDSPAEHEQIGTLDDYMNIPAALSGFVYTYDYILEPGVLATMAPEIACVATTQIDVEGDATGPVGYIVDGFSLYKDKKNTRKVQQGDTVFPWENIETTPITFADSDVMEPSILEPSTRLSKFVVPTTPALPSVFAPSASYMLEETIGKITNIVVRNTDILIDEHYDLPDINNKIENITTNITEINTNITEINTNIENIDVDIDNMKVDITEINTNIENIEVDIDNIKVDITEINTNITEINTDIENINTDIENIENDIDNIKIDLDNVKIDLDNVKIDIDNLKQATEAAQNSNVCENFKIYMNNEGATSPIVPGEYGDSGFVSPRYGVTRGTVLVNGKKLELEGIDDIEPPFLVHIIRNNATEGFGLALVADELRDGTDTTSDVIMETIGGVSEDTFMQTIGSSSKKHTLYAIHQYTCSPSITYIPLNAPGVVVYTGDNDSLSPFTTYPTAKCDEDE